MRRKLIETKQIAPYRWHSNAEIEEALRSSCGFKSEAARILGTSPAMVTQRVDKSARLKEVLEEITENDLDLAERKLHDAIENAEPWAVLFLLRCRGKSRGWGEKTQVEIEGKFTGGVLQVPMPIKDLKVWEAMAQENQRELESKFGVIENTNLIEEGGE